MRRKTIDLTNLFEKEGALLEDINTYVDAKNREVSAVRAQIVMQGLLRYASKEVRCKLISKLETTPFSKSTLEYMRKFNDCWDQDSVDYNTIKTFLLGETFLDDSSIPESLAEKVGSFILSEEVEK